MNYELSPSRPLLACPRTHQRGHARGRQAGSQRSNHWTMLARTSIRRLSTSTPSTCRWHQSPSAPLATAAIPKSGAASTRKRRRVIHHSEDQCDPKQRSPTPLKAQAGAVDCRVSAPPPTVAGGAAADAGAASAGASQWRYCCHSASWTNCLSRSCSLYCSSCTRSRKNRQWGYLLAVHMGLAWRTPLWLAVGRADGLTSGTWRTRAASSTASTGGS